MERLKARWSRLKDWQKIVVVTIAGGLALIPFAAVNDDSGTPHPASGQSTSRYYSNDDVEFKLAVIDLETLDVTDAQIAEYEQVLDSLEDKCTENRELIGDMAVHSVGILTDNGIRTHDTLSMMREVDTALVFGSAVRSCNETYAHITVTMLG